MIATIMSHHLQALLACVAPTTDDRFYLRGVFIDPEARQAVATNGRIIMAAPLIVLEGTPPKDIIIAPFKPPRRKLPFIVTLDTDLGQAESLHGLADFELIDGRYPDWRRAGRYTSHVRGAHVRIALNPSLLAAPQKALNVEGCILSPDETGKGPIRVTWLGEPDIFTAVMPIRI